MDRSANTNAVKREYEQSTTSQRRVLNEGGATDQYEQDASQEDGTFHQGEGSSRSFPYQHQTDARRNQEKLHELLNGQGQGRHARTHMHRQEDRSRRRLNEINGFCGSVESTLVQQKQKKDQCARLADCAKDYSLYDLFIYMHGDDIDFDDGTVDKRIRGFDEINMQGKLRRIKGLSADLLDPEPNWLGFLPFGKCDELLQQFHRFDEGLGTFGGIWQGGSVTSVCRGQGTSKFLSLQSIAQIMISLYNNAYPHEKALDNSPGLNGLSPGLLELCQGDCDDDSDCAEGLECFERNGNTGVPGCTGNMTEHPGRDYCIVNQDGTGEGKMPNATFFLPDTFLVDIFEEFVGCAVSFCTKFNSMHINPFLNGFFSLRFTGRYWQTAIIGEGLQKLVYRC
jgi:hypothetical protein